MLAQHGLHLLESSLRAGETLFAFGEPRRAIWLLRAGWVTARVHSPFGQEAMTAIFGAGEIVGGAASLGRPTYPCTVAALTDVQALTVPAEAFERWVQNDARAACRLVEIVGKRLDESNELQAINTARAEVRLRLTLGWMTRKFGREIPATRVLLGELTGLRPETCSRVLSDLRRRGIVRVSPRRIEVLRPERLEPARNRA